MAVMAKGGQAQTKLEEVVEAAMAVWPEPHRPGKRSKRPASSGVDR